MKDRTLLVLGNLFLVVAGVIVLVTVVSIVLLPFVLLAIPFYLIGVVLLGIREARKPQVEVSPEPIEIEMHVQLHDQKGEVRFR